MADKEKHFRSNWAPQLHKPMKQPFLPTPPPQAPKIKKEQVELVSTERIKRAPAEALAAGVVNINDRNNDYRGYIAEDGTCVNNLNEVIGYINKDSYECGSSDERFLGFGKEGVMDNIFEIYDNLDELVGTLDLGTAVLKDGNRKIIGEIEGTGECKGHWGSYLGRFNGFSFKEMRIIALYLILIDPGMLNEVEG